MELASRLLTVCVLSTGCEVVKVDILQYGLGGQREAKGMILY